MTFFCNFFRYLYGDIQKLSCVANSNYVFAILKTQNYVAMATCHAKLHYFLAMGEIIICCHGNTTYVAMQTQSVTMPNLIIYFEMSTFTFFCHGKILPLFAMATLLLNTWQFYFNLHGNFYSTLPCQKFTFFAMAKIYLRSHGKFTSKYMAILL